MTRMAEAADARSTGPMPTTALVLAWSMTLLLSRLPEIVLREVVGWDVPTINIVWIVVAAGLIVAASMVPLMRPFRDYLVVMLTVLILTTVVDPLFVPPFSATSPRLAPIPSCGACSLSGSCSYSRRSRSSRCWRRLDTAAVSVPRPWQPQGANRAAYRTTGAVVAVVGPIVSVLLVAATAAFASSMASPTPDCGRGLSRYFRSLGWRRHSTRSRRRFCIGLGRSALWRGLSGRGPVLDPRGLVRSRPRLRRHPIRGDGVRHGWLARAALGQAMIDTRGLGVPWALHFSADAAIYTFLAVAAVASTT